MPHAICNAHAQMKTFHAHTLNRPCPKEYLTPTRASLCPYRLSYSCRFLALLAPIEHRHAHMSTFHTHMKSSVPLIWHRKVSFGHYRYLSQNPVFFTRHRKSSFGHYHTRLMLRFYTLYPNWLTRNRYRILRLSRSPALQSMANGVI